MKKIYVLVLICFLTIPFSGLMAQGKSDQNKGKGKEKIEKLKKQLLTSE